MHDRLDLGVGEDGEAVVDLGAMARSWRRGAGMGPVDACEGGGVVAAVGVFAGADHDAAVQEGETEGPEGGGEVAWLKDGQ